MKATEGSGAWQRLTTSSKAERSPAELDNVRQYPAKSIIANVLSQASNSSGDYPNPEPDQKGTRRQHHIFFQHCTATYLILSQNGRFFQISYN